MRDAVTIKRRLSNDGWVPEPNRLAGSHGVYDPPLILFALAPIPMMPCDGGADR